MKSNISFYPMDYSDFWSRPEYLKVGYTFRNGGGEGDIVFTLLDDFDEEKYNSVRVLCHNIRTGFTYTETWNDTQYLKGAFDNGEYFHYNKKCDWLTEYYKKD